MLLTIALPAFNEESALGDVLERAIVTANSLIPGQYECLIVDDGSTDATLEITRHLQRSHPQIRILSNGRPSGFAAVQKQ